MKLLACLALFLAVALAQDIQVTFGNNPNYPGNGGWGESYYFDGVETPEMFVFRDQQYTFQVQATSRHPFYVTSDENGGPAARQPPGPLAGEVIYAGSADSFGEPGSPFQVDWTPDAATLDTVYYQCWTHKNIGWKFNVLDAGSAIPLTFTTETNVFHPSNDVATEVIYVNGAESPIITLVRGQQYAITASLGAGELIIVDDAIGGASFSGSVIFTGTGMWTPDAGTPDLVYYQSDAADDIGWKLMIVDAPGHTLIHPPLKPPSGTVIETLPLLNGFDSCMQLDRSTRLYWTVGATEIDYALQGTASEDRWISFGVSANQDPSGAMIGGDVTAVYHEAGSEFAVDMYLQSRQQCNNGNVGVCPDSGDRATSSVMTSSDFTNGILTVEYTRPLAGTAPEHVTIDPAVEATTLYARGPICAGGNGLICFHDEVYEVSTLIFNDRSSCLPQRDPCYADVAGVAFPAGALHEVAGTVEFYGPGEIIISGFTYDALGPETAFYLGTPGDFENGVAISEALGTTRYDGEDVVVTFDPALLDDAANTHLSVWCITAKVDFGNIEIPALPTCTAIPDPESACYPGDISLPFDTPAAGPNPHGVAGTASLYGATSMVVSDFSFDGAAPSTYFYLGSETVPGVRVSEIRLSREYDAESVALSFTKTQLSMYTHLHVYCETAQESFGALLIPVPDCTPSAEQCFPSESSAPISAGAAPVHDVVGTIRVFGANTILVEGFSFDGLAPDTHFFLANDANNIPGGIEVSPQLSRAYSSESFLIEVPSNIDVYSYTILSVWCKIAAANFGHTTLPADPRLGTCEMPMTTCPESEAFALPSGNTQHDVSGTVTVISATELRVNNLVYDGTAPAVYLRLGNGADFSNGVRIGNKLRKRFDGETFTVTVEDGLLAQYNSVSVWCETFSANFGHAVYSVEETCFGSETTTSAGNTVVFGLGALSLALLALM